jgi:hypothetical protein
MAPYFQEKLLELQNKERHTAGCGSDCLEFLEIEDKRIAERNYYLQKFNH